jgi:hypothetical protein
MNDDERTSENVGRLTRMAGAWVCSSCADRISVGAAFGGGLSPVTYGLNLGLTDRLLGRRRVVRHEGTCGECHRAGWFETHER